MRMLLKDLNIKSLVSGDKSARITLETLRPQDIETLAGLAEATEVDVTFTTGELSKEGVEMLAKLGNVKLSKEYKR